MYICIYIRVYIRTLYTCVYMYIHEYDSQPQKDSRIFLRLAPIVTEIYTSFVIFEQCETSVSTSG